MKTSIKLFTIIFATALLASCNSEHNTQAENSVQDLRTYVDSVNKVENNEENWNSIEMTYNEKADKVELATKDAEVDEKLKADYESIKADYAALKTKYQQNSTMAYKKKLRTSLFGEGVLGQDISFDFVTAANAATVYDRFVSSIIANKDMYTREDWDEVKVLYEALDTRKNAIEKDLSGPDNRKIAGLKMRFASIKAVNRPGSKIDENADAKDVAVQ